MNQHTASHLLDSYHDEGEVILKSLEIEDILKGRTAKPIGHKETWGGKDYIKTANGWKAVGKNGGAAKEAHDFVHGTNDESKKVIGTTKEGNNIYQHQKDKTDSDLEKLKNGEALKKVRKDDKGNAYFEVIQPNKGEEDSYARYHHTGDKSKAVKQNAYLSGDDVHHHLLHSLANHQAEMEKKDKKE